MAMTDGHRFLAISGYSRCFQAGIGYRIRTYREPGSMKPSCSSWDVLWCCERSQDGSRLLTNWSLVPYTNTKTLEYLNLSVRCEIAWLAERPPTYPTFGHHVVTQRQRKVFIPRRFHICMETIPPVGAAGARQSPYRKPRRPRRYERFGEIIRYMTQDELQQFFDCVDQYSHKLIFQVIYELGCRVGEFVRIQIKHVHFRRSTIFLPAENTKTKHPRISYLPRGLTNELKSLLKHKGLMNKRDDRVLRADAYLFHPGKRWNTPYTENRIRQIFQHYIAKAGLQQVYGKDTRGRALRMFTVHSLRHSHIMSYVVDRGVPLPIVQKQVGHRNLKTTSVYLSPSTEKMARAYGDARKATEGPRSQAPYAA